MLGKLSIKVKGDRFCDGQVSIDGVDITKHVRGIDFSGFAGSIPKINLHILASPEEIEFSGEYDLTLRIAGQEYRCRVISKGPVKDTE